MNWNPEKQAMHNESKDRTFKREKGIERGAQTLLRRWENIHRQVEAAAIDPRDFEDLYGTDTIERDLRYVADMRAKFRASESEVLRGTDLTQGDVRKLAEILEALIVSGINGHNWIPHCQAIKTSEYDDIANGVDAVVEYTKPQQTGHLGLGVDVTFSHNLQGKFERIKREIDEYDGEKNRLGTVKYFNSARSGIHGSLFGMPRVVAALDVGVMQDLFTRGVSRENHAAKHALLIELKQQLTVFRAYAHTHNRDCVEQFDRALNFIEEIIKETDSERILSQSEYGKNEEVEAAIQRGLALFE